MANIVDVSSIEEFFKIAVPKLSMGHDYRVRFHMPPPTDADATAKINEFRDSLPEYIVQRYIEFVNIKTE